MTPSRTSRLKPDPFVLGRIAALQPRMDIDALTEPVMATQDPLIFTNVANAVRIWSHSRNDLPNDFSDRVTIASVSRQPIAFVAVDLQHVTRSVVQYEEPFAGGKFDDSPWTTQDPFKLRPVATTVFPPEPATMELLLDGRQDVRSCEECKGAGENQCVHCGGAGSNLCPECGGVQRIPCSRCGGTGQHVGISGNYIQCQVCHTRGTVACRRCTAGRVRCNHCAARGTVRCAKCAGHGNLRTRWKIVSHTVTRTRHAPVSPEPWPLDSDTLLDESSLVASMQWEWPATAGPPRPVESFVPPRLLPDALELVRSGVTTAGQADATIEQITGLRLRLLGTYLYQVGFDFDGRSGRLFIGGNRCRVFPDSLPIQPAGVLKSIRRISRRALGALASDQRPGLDRAYIDAVLAGRAHICDERFLMPAVATAASAQLAVTETGYALTLERKGTTVSIAVELDAVDQHLLLCAQHVLGPAQRELFPKALTLNNDLSFGRIAVVDVDRQHMFALVDRRPYQTMSADHYAWILRAIADDVREIKISGVLD